LAREILRYEPGNSLILEYSRTLAELSALQDAEAKAADSEEEEEEEEDKGEEEEGDEKEDDDEGEGSSEDEGKAQDVGDSLGHSIRDERKPAPSVADHERRLYALLEEAERDKRRAETQAEAVAEPKAFVPVREMKIGLEDNSDYQGDKWGRK